MNALPRIVALLGGVALLVAAVVAGGGASNAGATTTPDYRRALQIVADLRAYPPTDPLICMLGGSSARSSTVSDASWSAQVRRNVGYRVVAVNLGSKERLLTQDRRLVRLLPRGHPIVYIGVNMGRFCRGHADPAIVLPKPSGEPPTLQQRKVVRTQPLSEMRKRQMVAEWMQERWPYFLRNYRYNLGVLDSAVRRSLARGQHPVIIDLPRNMAIMGHQLDGPLRIYHAGCRAIAKRYGVPYVQFQGRLALTSRDFRDLWHLLPTSRMKWQRELSKTTAALLRRYRLRPTPSPSPSVDPGLSPSPDPSLSPSADPSLSPSAAPAL